MDFYRHITKCSRLTTMSSATMALGTLMLLALVSAAPNPVAAQAEWNEIPLMPGTYREYAATHRSDTVDIPVRPNGGEIEYMLNMKMGDSIVYSWRAVDIADPQKLTSEFHGHTERVGNAPGTLIFYRKATGGSEGGSLVAPFDGIHGWYLKNDTDRPVVVRLSVAGFYQPIPGQVPN